MCLYVDYYDSDWLPLSDGTVQRCRVEHRCDDCNRTIDVGEGYRWWSGLDYGRVETVKQCRHCTAVLDVGVAITGCPRAWFTGSMYDRDPEIGFVANVLHDDGHDLSDAAWQLCESMLAAGRSGWRDPDGALLPVPTAPALEDAS